MTATGDGLRWGIRAGFRDYLAALPDTRVDRQGAEFGEDGYRFPADGGAFTGSVRITAHEGALDVTLARPAIGTAGDGRAVLSGDIGGRRIDIAFLLDVEDADALAAQGGSAHDVALTADGSAWLGGVYGPWARMDAVHVDRSPRTPHTHPPAS